MPYENKQSEFGKSLVQSNSLFGKQQNSSLFGGQTTQPTSTLFGSQPNQPTSTVFGGQTTQPTSTLFSAQTTQPSNSLFGVQQPSTNSALVNQTNPSFLSNEQGINTTAPKFGADHCIIQTILELSKKIDTLTEQVKNLSLPPPPSTSNEKVIYIACNLHEHILYETNPEKITGILNTKHSTPINKFSYTNGFKCDMCSLDFKPNNHMYHCETCEQANKLFDICESCIRKSLKS